MKFLITSLLLIFLFFAQNPRKTDNSLLIKKAEYLTNIDNDSALYYAKKAFLGAENECESINALYIEANVLYFNSELTLSKDKCLNLLEKIDFQKENLSEACYAKFKNRVLQRLFYLEKRFENYEEALCYLEENRELYNELSLYFPKYNYSLELQSASINNVLENHHKSLNILYEMLKHKKEYSYIEHGEINVYSDISSTYVKQYKEELDERLLDSIAKYNDLTQVKIKNKKIKSTSNISEVIHILRKVFIQVERKNNLQALKYIRKARQLNKKGKNDLDFGLDYYSSYCFSKLKNSDSTIFYSKQFIERHKQNPVNKEQLTKIYAILGEQYKNLNIDSLAYKYSNLALSTSKDISAIKLKSTRELEDFNINSLNQKNKAIVNDKNKALSLTYLVSTLLLLISGFLLIQYIINKKRTEKYQTLIDSLTQEHTIIEKNTSQKDYTIKDNIKLEILNGIDLLEKDKKFLSIDFTLYNVSKLLNSNTSYVSRVINIEKGQSFKEYTNTLRMNYITKELQKNTSLNKYTIDAIAKEVGYASSSSFSKIFKQHTGISPSFFIKNIAKESNKKKNNENGL